MTLRIWQTIAVRLFHCHCPNAVRHFNYNADHGKDFKYTGSYEDAAMLIRKNVVAWKVEMSNFFMLVVFNYLFSNGDAHLKNFSLQQTTGGDYILTPAYDLLNTSIHIDDGDFALKEGLIPPAVHSEAYRRTGIPAKMILWSWAAELEYCLKR